MTTKTQYFIMEMFNVPKNTTKSNLTIANNNIISWNVVSVKEKNGEYVAYILILTKTSISTDILEGEVDVSANNHEVMGTNLFIHTKEYYEECLTKLLETYTPSDTTSHAEIKWLADFLDYEMDPLNNLLFINDECPLYTEEMASKYWKYIESLEDDNDEELPHDVNRDICVMENTKLPTEKLYITYHDQGSDAVNEFEDARDNIDTYYPVQAG
jgi:hypothetical protein